MLAIRGAPWSLSALSLFLVTRTRFESQTFPLPSTSFVYQPQEIMFEKFGVPAEFMSKDAVLAAFSIGRTTAALADVGGDTTVVTPVVDG